MTTRSLSGQHAEGSKREDTGNDNFASETNGLPMQSFIAVINQSLPGPGYPLSEVSLPYCICFGPVTLFPSLAFDLGGMISSLRTDPLCSARPQPLIMTEPNLT